MVERLHGEWTGLGVFRGICFIKIQKLLVCLSFGKIETSSSLDKGIKLEKKINQRGYFFSRKYMPLGDPSKDLPIPTQLDWRKQYQDAG